MMIAHGGDARMVADQLGIEASEILDFSANVNPRGLPLRAMERLKAEASNTELLTLYPDPSARHLRDALGRKLGIPSDAIAVGPGAEALLGPILRSLPKGRALVPVPAFSEYKRVCIREGVEYVPFALERSDCFRLPARRFCERINSGRYEVIILNNPHNPSGFALTANAILSLVEATSADRGSVVLDEAFIDYAPQASLTLEAAARPELIVLRSLTKFYGCPALRVGYAVASPETVRRIVSFLPSWPVTHLASETLVEALEDDEYAKRSLAENAIERERLRQSLAALGLTVFPSAANYLFFELGEKMRTSAEIRRRMIERHRILIRDCDSYECLSPGRYVRVAVRTRGENDRLLHALAQELLAE